MTLPRTCVWNRLDEQGIGLARFNTNQDGFVTRGYEVTTSGGVRFQVHLDEHWQTKTARIGTDGSSGPCHLELEADGQGSWDINGEPSEDLDGCLDIDIAAIPCTNTFPIRRLGLDVGEEKSLMAVWVGIPDLDIEVFKQIYRCLRPENDLDCYAYRPAGSSQERKISVDDEGIVVHYEKFAECMASWDV